MRAWAVAMMVVGGLFAGGVAFFAWERIPSWRRMGLPEFGPDFTRSVRRADRLQPVLLVIYLVCTIGFAASAAGTARTLAILEAASLLLIGIGSGAFLIPLQKRIMATSGSDGSEDVEVMRRRWFNGHLIRTALALTAFLLAAIAGTT